MFDDELNCVFVGVVFYLLEFFWFHFSIGICYIDNVIDQIGDFDIGIVVRNLNSNVRVLFVVLFGLCLG